MIPIPIGTDRPQRHFPWMNALLIAANILIYFLSHSVSLGNAPVPLLPPAADAGLAPGWAKFMLDPQNSTLYQFFTYQFLHLSLSHIFFNMLFLYVFGNNLNEKLGHAGYLAFFLTGGILAGCGQVLMSDGRTLGASGAISAVTGMYLALLPQTQVRLFIWFFLYIDRWEIPAIYVIFFSIGKDILEPLLMPHSGTAHAAHLTGNAAGFLIGMLLLLTGLTQRDHYDFLAMIERWRRRKAYESAVSQGWNAFDPRPGVRAGTGIKATPIDAALLLQREEILALLRAHNLPAATEKYLALRAVDPRQALPPQDQLDVANQLMTDQRYASAADAYEDYLRLYPREMQAEQAMLVLSLIYSQYLPKPDRARALLQAVLPRLHDPKQRAFAETELAKLPPPVSPTSP